MRKILSSFLILIFTFQIFFLNLNSTKAQVSFSCAYLSFNLKVGSRDFYTDGDVSKLQVFLYEHGYLNTVTGYFGNLTKNAVINFQRDNHIIETGNVMSLTRHVIKESSCHKITQIPETTNNTNTNPVTNYCSLDTEYSTEGIVIRKDLCTCPQNSIQIFSSNHMNFKCAINPAPSTFYCNLNNQNYFSQADYFYYCK